MSNAEAVLRVSGYCLAFFIIHSLLVAENVKSRISHSIPPRIMRGWYRLSYTIVSIATLLVCVWLISRVPDITLYSFPRSIGWPMHGVQLMGAIFGIYSYRQIRSDEFTGLAQARKSLGGIDPGGNMEGISETGLITTGGYAVVRNPLYLAGITVFAFQPHITRSWAAVSALSIAYFIWGAVIEERRMLRRFGDEYREYMKLVPLLVPRPKALFTWARGLLRQ